MSKTHTPSGLLSEHENQVLFELLGRKTLSLATTVVQVYLALPNSTTYWTKCHSGVACFIKDNPKRSFFIRVYSLKEGKLVWEQELYNQIRYASKQPYFHTFAADRKGVNDEELKELQAHQEAMEKET
ncbi:actin nucleation-promoting factor WAS-like [Scyliorhinus torazame]|uniref:actin nucleation-promoting factor WAS-like n=1 Tax=Scyliorhinus torazame TaxID=75743 RepID=UPI003B5BFD7D